MPGLTKQQLRRRLDEEHNALLRSMRDLDEQTIVTETITDQWTLKDIIGHIISWGDELRYEIRAIRENPAPAYDYIISMDDDIHDWNQTQADQKREWSWSQMRTDLDRDYAEMCALIEELTADDLEKRGVVPWLLKALPAPQKIKQGTASKLRELVRTHYLHIPHSRIDENNFTPATRLRLVDSILIYGSAQYMREHMRMIRW